VVTVLRDAPRQIAVRVKDKVMNEKRFAAILKRGLSPYKLSVYHLLRERAIADSAAYAEQHLNTAMIFNEDVKLWDFAASTAKVEGGLILEFGVFKGRSITRFAQIFQDTTLHGFDSFEGLAENWTGYHLAKGAFNLGGAMPAVPDNVTLHKGWFNETLPDFLKANKAKLRLCHVDCDTYESSLYVLTQISKSLVKGSVIVFDEYYGYPNWKFGEYRAWQEVCAAKKINYRYIAFANMQVAVEVI